MIVLKSDSLRDSYVYDDELLSAIALVGWVDAFYPTSCFTHNLIHFHHSIAIAPPKEIANAYSKHSRTRVLFSDERLPKMKERALPL